MGNRFVFQLVGYLFLYIVVGTVVYRRLKDAPRGVVLVGLAIGIVLLMWGTIGIAALTRNWEFDSFVMAVFRNKQTQALPFGLALIFGILARILHDVASGRSGKM